MTTDTDPRVETVLAMISNACAGLDEMGCATVTSDVRFRVIETYLKQEFAKVPSAPVEAVPQDLFRTALKHCYNVMGPKTPPCCDGCSFEWSEALKTIREALGIKEGEYPEPLGATTPPQAEPSQSAPSTEIRSLWLQLQDRDHTIARLNAELSFASNLAAANVSEVERLTAELQEVRKDAARWKAVEEMIDAPRLSGHEGQRFMLGFYDPREERFICECFNYAECVDAAIAAAPEATNGRPE